MTQPSTNSVERLISKICKIEFANPGEFGRPSDLGIHDIEKRLGHYLGIANKYL